MQYGYLVLMVLMFLAATLILDRQAAHAAHFPRRAQLYKHRLRSTR